MKSFLEEYGFSILAAIVVILLIMMISPLGAYFKSGMTTIAGKFGGTAEGLANRLEILPDSNDEQDKQEEETTLGPGLYKNGELVYDWDELFENQILVNYDQGLDCPKKDLLDGDLVLPEEPFVFKTGAFAGASKLESINIPEGTTSISQAAFYRCTSLKKVKLPNTLTTISANAFYICSSLESIEIPDSVTVIGKNVFNGCSSLKSVRLPSFITVIDSYTFDGCSSLESITIPSAVTTINNSVFTGVNMERLEIPSTVTSLDTYFLMNSHVKTLVINNYYSSGVDVGTQVENVVYNNVLNTTRILGYGINNSPILRKVTINGDSPVVITSYSFNGISSLNSIEFNAPISKIQNSAFAYTGFTSFDIPNGVTELGSASFNSSALTTVSIPETVRKIDYGSFTATQLTSANFAVTSGWSDSSVNFSNPSAAAERLKNGNILTR